MDFEKELLEICAFLDMLSHCDFDKDFDILDLQTLAKLFSKKADNLYCYMLDTYLKLKK